MLQDIIATLGVDELSEERITEKMSALLTEEYLEERARPEPWDRWENAEPYHRSPRR